MDKELENRLSLLLGAKIKTIQPVAGGDISPAFLLETSTDRLFCKIRRGADAAAMFRAEKNGLEAIAQCGIVKTPGVLFCENLDGTAVLILEFIESRTPSKLEMSTFGEELAALHALGQENFGWENANYIGSLPQLNRSHESWALFYLNERLLPQFKIAENRVRMNCNEIPGAAVMLPVIERLFHNVKPSLLHGDLWSGNYLVSHTGKAYLVDPAVYRGHCEVDLAMSRLFGGFGQSFYQGYESVLQKREGAEERQEIYQLYYLLVHLNLFGGSYRDSVMKTVRRFFLT